MKQKKQRILNVLLVLVIAALAASGWRMYSNHVEDAAADAAADAMQAMKPPTPRPSPTQDSSSGNGLADTGYLMDFSSLWAENPDVVAWLSIPGTVIDYPVLQAADNEYYLERDITRTSNKNGSLFLDFRARADFLDFSSVIYGHNMHSGRMLTDVVNFKEEAFFDLHTVGTLYTPDRTFRLEIFAVAVTPPDSEWYNYAFVSIGQRQAQLDMMKRGAMHYRDIGLTVDDRFVVLSTCSYEFWDARTIVAARLV